MRHLYECPMRWADLDLQGHVNNVTYVDLLQEARVDMLRIHSDREAGEPAADLAEGVVVVRHEVDYRAPLTFEAWDPTPSVGIECWVTEVRAASFTLAYEVFTQSPGGERVVHAAASTMLTPYVFATERPRRVGEQERDRLERFLEPGDPVRRLGSRERREEHHQPVHVRFSDVDVYGHVNNVQYFTYLQEARIALLGRLVRDLDGPRPTLVVARTEVDYTRPILFRQRPYDLWSWVGAVGRTSYTIESVIADGDAELARARVVMVVVDPDTQRPTPIADGLRERLEPSR